jgi:hypothetical protein
VARTKPIAAVVLAATVLLSGCTGTAKRPVARATVLPSPSPSDSPSPYDSASPAPSSSASPTPTEPSSPAPVVFRMLAPKLHTGAIVKDCVAVLFEGPDMPGTHYYIAIWTGLGDNGWWINPNVEQDGPTSWSGVATFGSGTFGDRSRFRLEIIAATSSAVKTSQAYAKVKNGDGTWFAKVLPDHAAIDYNMPVRRTPGQNYNC